MNIEIRSSAVLAYGANEAIVLSVIEGWSGDWCGASPENISRRTECLTPYEVREALDSLEECDAIVSRKSDDGTREYLVVAG